MSTENQRKRTVGEIETAHSGYLGTQDTYYVGTIKSVGRLFVRRRSFGVATPLTRSTIRAIQS